jgi:DNA polymerase-3 subunit chi
MAGSDERVEALTQHLWTHKPDSFLPHGNSKDGNPEAQPIWLTAKDERPNDAAFLFLTDGAETARVSDYERICEIFDGNDETAVAAARQRWGSYKIAGHNLSYWQQGDRGWEDKTPQ